MSDQSNVPQTRFVLLTILNGGSPFASASTHLLPGELIDMISNIIGDDELPLILARLNKHCKAKALECDAIWKSKYEEAWGTDLAPTGVGVWKRAYYMRQEIYNIPGKHI